MTWVIAAAVLSLTAWNVSLSKLRITPLMKTRVRLGLGINTDNKPTCAINSICTARYSSCNNRSCMTLGDRAAQPDVGKLSRSICNVKWGEEEISILWRAWPLGVYRVPSIRPVIGSQTIATMEAYKSILGPCQACWRGSGWYLTTPLLQYPNTPFFTSSTSAFYTPSTLIVHPNLPST